MSTVAYSAFLHFVAFLTLILQLFLFYLIQKKSPRTMKNYRAYLNYFTLWELILGILFGNVLQPEAIGQALVKPNGLAALLGPRFQVLAVSLIVYAAVNVIVAQNCCLIFRYLAVHENKNLQQGFLSKRAKLICFLFAQLFSIVAGFVVQAMMISPERFPDAMDQKQREEYLKYAQPGEFIIVPDLSSKLPRVFVATIVFLCFITEVIAGYVVYAILSKLRRNSKVYSKTTYRLHFQLTVLLGIQICIPVIFLMLPTLLRWLLFAIGVELPSASSKIGFMFVGLYSLTNSILTIACVAPFRYEVYNLLIFPWFSPLMRALHAEGWAPRRKSIGVVSTTRPDLKHNNTVFVQSSSNSN